MSKEEIELTYEEALKELQQIAASIESEEVAIDSLEEKVKRAVSLINYCKNKLRNTEDAIKQTLD
jgi:exodeoxyribonuclease VII small subunit